MKKNVYNIQVVRKFNIKLYMMLYDVFFLAVRRGGGGYRDISYS